MNKSLVLIITLMGLWCFSCIEAANKRTPSASNLTKIEQTFDRIDSDDDKKALCCDCLSKFIIFCDNCCDYPKETCEAPIKVGRGIDKINPDCFIIAGCYCAAICTIGSQASTNEHSSIFAFKDLVTQFITCFIVHDSPKHKASDA